jgi:hypothetical protein
MNKGAIETIETPTTGTKNKAVVVETAAAPADTILSEQDDATTNRRNSFSNVVERLGELAARGWWSDI